MIVTATHSLLPSSPSGKTTETWRQAAAATPATLAEPVSISAAGRQALANDGSTSGIEQYAIPGWFADFGFALSSEPGTPGDWFARQYPEAAAAAQSERNAYTQRIDSHYRSLLADNGVNDTASHYQTLIVDQAASEKLHQQMLEQIKADPVLMALLPKMGKAHLVA